MKNFYRFLRRAETTADINTIYITDFLEVIDSTDTKDYLFLALVDKLNRSTENKKVFI